MAFGGTGEKAVQAHCEALNASQADHKVTCINQGSYEESMQKAIAAVRSNQHPVLIQFFDAGTLDLMLSGVMEPVQQAMPDVDWSSYIAGARSYYETSKGELYSQPYNASTLIFYGNKELLAKAAWTPCPKPMNRRSRLRRN
ncbi:MAG: extracellular solute-binding protein [Paracoccus sp. (in: a-proteobacteria)]|nr:extracellular solute-binding protein [Paracoccus sp. (in: a-proteobacteria)]MDO5647633.1 extracellular solute-binding protein [Paracoccus sp. (in: a-proteobacteria)]